MKKTLNDTQVAAKRGTPTTNPRDLFTYGFTQERFLAWQQHEKPMPPPRKVRP